MFTFCLSVSVSGRLQLRALIRRSGRPAAGSWVQEWEGDEGCQEPTLVFSDPVVECTKKTVINDSLKFVFLLKVPRGDCSFGK